MNGRKILHRTLIVITVCAVVGAYSAPLWAHAQQEYTATSRRVDTNGPDVWLFEDNYVRCHIFPDGQHCKDK